MNIKSSLIKKLLLSLTFILSFFLGNLAVQAGDYPDRPISVVVAYNPGGATDFQARLVTMMALLITSVTIRLLMKCALLSRHYTIFVQLRFSVVLRPQVLDMCGLLLLYMISQLCMECH